MLLLQAGKVLRISEAYEKERPIFSVLDPFYVGFVTVQGLRYVQAE